MAKWLNYLLGVALLILSFQYFFQKYLVIPEEYSLFVLLGVGVFMVILSPFQVPAGVAGRTKLGMWFCRIAGVFIALLALIEVLDQFGFSDIPFVSNTLFIGNNPIMAFVIFMIALILFRLPNNKLAPRILSNS